MSIVFGYLLLAFGWSNIAPPPDKCAYKEKPDDITIHYLKGARFFEVSNCYLLLAPTETTESMPMIVLLHGLGDSAVGLARSSIVTKLRKEMAAGSFPGSYILIPHGERGYWTNWNGIVKLEEGTLLEITMPTGNGVHNYEDNMLLMVNETRQRLSPSKVALVGISMGGFGALSIGLRYPEIFSVLVAMSPTDMEIAVTEAPKSSLYTSIYGDPIHMPYVAALNPRELIIRGAGQDQILAWVYGTNEQKKFKHGAERLLQVAQVNGLKPEVRVIENGTHSFITTWGGETIDWWMALLYDFFKEE